MCQLNKVRLLKHPLKIIQLDIVDEEDIVLLQFAQEHTDILDNNSVDKLVATGFNRSSQFRGGILMTPSPWDYSGFVCFSVESSEHFPA